MARSNTANGGSSYFDLVILPVATSESAYTLRAVISVTSLNVQDSSNDLSVGGNWSRSGALALSGVYSGTAVWSQDITVARSTSPVTVSVSASWAGVNYWGATLSASESYTVPAAAPGGIYTEATVLSSSSVRLGSGNPAGGGGILEFQFQSALTADMAGATTYSHTGFLYDVTGLAAGTTYFFRSRQRNAAGWSAWSAVVAATTLVNPPAAPSGVTVARVSDTQQSVSWTNNASTGAPYGSLVVLRSTDGGAWAQIATLAGSATSYADTTTAANRQYRYFVRAVNASGSSDSAQSASIPTTPTGPTGAVATKVGSNIVVDWTNRSTYGQPEVWHAANGVYDAAPLATLAAGATSWTHAGPSPSQTHQYRVFAVATAGAETLRSLASFSDTNVVQLQAPPNAPGGLGPGGTVDATEAITLVWTHNPVDTTGQTKFQIRIRQIGASAWVEGGEQGGSSSELPLTSLLAAWGIPNGSGMEWQVRTWGAHPDPSPWSATATILTSARPTATISSPGATVDRSSVVVSWAYYDPEGGAQAAWEVALYDVATLALVEYRQGVGAATSALMSTVLPNGSSWTAAVAVTDAAGMVSALDTQTFTVDYAEPPTPSISPTWDPASGSVQLVVTAPEPSVGQVPIVHLDVWRLIDDWELIATGVPVGTTLTDWSPPLSGEVTYRVWAYSALPSAAQGEDVTVTTGNANAAFVSGGPGFSQVCRAVSNIAISARSGRAEKVLHRFAGRARPVEFAGEGLVRSWSVSFDLILSSGFDESSADEWLALADLPGPHLLRTPDLRRFVALSDVTVARGLGGVVTGVSFTATEVDSA